MNITQEEYEMALEATERVASADRRYAEDILEEALYDWEHNKRYLKDIMGGLFIEEDIEVEVNPNERNSAFINRVKTALEEDNAPANKMYDILDALPKQIFNLANDPIHWMFAEDMNLEDAPAKYLQKLGFPKLVIDQFALTNQTTKQKGKIRISIHPLDYLLMSEGSFTSCHSLSGAYSMGTLSYMHDEATLISCLYRQDMDTCGGSWNKKMWRSCIYSSTSALTFIQSRQYPEVYEEVEESVRRLWEDAISKSLGVEDKWVKSSSVENFNQCGQAYSDVLYTSHKTTQVRHKSLGTPESIWAGYEIMCRDCGEEPTQTDNCLCENCY